MFASRRALRFVVGAPRLRPARTFGSHSTHAPAVPTSRSDGPAFYPPKPLTGKCGIRADGGGHNTSLGHGAYAGHGPTGVFAPAAHHAEEGAHKPEYETYTAGAANTKDFRVFFRKQGHAGNLSPWHDIPMVHNMEERTFYYVNEIPKGTRAKMEVNTKDAENPISQDLKKGALRFFKYGDIPFNYGCVPQTWEDPNTKNALTGYAGDNDPVDVVEISRTPMAVGEVVGVKVLGLMALIDEDETDWKVIAINVNNPLAKLMNNDRDIDRIIPGCTEAIREWFRMYKTADGKPENVFAFDEKVMPQEMAWDVLFETHHSWEALRAGKAKNKKNLWLGKPAEKEEPKAETPKKH